MVLEYILLAVLLATALFIVIAVTLQRSNDEGLSSSIAGGSDTYYGKDKAPSAEKAWFKWTLIASVVFAVAVLITYVIQPDYTYGFDLDYWKSLSEYSELFN